MAKGNENFANMTDKELEKAKIALEKERREIKDEMLAIQAEQDKRSLDADNERILGGMSDEQKASLLQSIKAEGIASTAKVGKPGGKK